jgi:hyperosmotically inducible periplasmic protein
MVFFLTGCSKSDQEQARERAKEAGQKTREDVRKLAHEAKQDARDLNQRIDKSLKDRPANVDQAMSQAGQKLDTAAHAARVEGEQAAGKLSRAALIAKVKTKLVNDVGLSTASSVDVDIHDDVVTLSGTVSSEDQKQQAERSASHVDGVSKVIDHLTVQH